MTEPTRNISFSILVLVAIVAAVVCFLTVFLLTNIFERKQEARVQVLHVVELDDDTVDPAIWGQNFPLQYDDFMKTVDMSQTMYGGSEALPQAPTAEDPRNSVSRSKLDTIPQLRRMWAGYAFSKDYREKRGHAYMLTDQIYTERQKVGQPGTCIHCHGSTYVAMKTLGDGNVLEGFEKLNTMPFHDAKEHVGHAVSCIDCHESRTLALRVTRPAFQEGIAAVKALEGINDYDVNRDATRQEMRSYVCAQCHVEYYFKGDNKRLTFPWSKGLTVDDAYAHFQESGFKDWVHAETGAPMLKAQHPEFELWSQGTHARAGVSCADCHMAYKRVGATKISDHHVRSPLLNVNASCGTCHKAEDQELIARTETIQTRHRKLVDVALDALMDLIDDLKTAKAQGATDEQLREPQQWQRKATFYADYVEAENSSGFHASQEAARILAESIDYSRRGQNALRETLLSQTVPIDDKNGNADVTPR